MKRLSGGLILLNLTAISLGLTSGEVDITDPDTLEELKELRNFIDVNRDFSKGFKNLKPVLIEYRSSASKFNGIALANMSFHTDALHLTIGCLVNNNGKYLNISIAVVYEWEDYTGYKVKTAKLNAYEKTALTGASIVGDVDVTGDVEVTGELSATSLGTIAGETNPSVKPIYCHPIRVYTMDNNADSSYMFSIMIFNNSATPINSRALLIQWLKDLYDLVGGTVTVNCSGFYKTITSSAYIFVTKSGTNYSFGIDGRGSTNVWDSVVETEENFLSGTMYVLDGVNKIN